MDTKTIRSKSVEYLTKALAEAREALRTLRFGATTAASAKDTREKKTLVARILTELRARKG